MNIKEKQLYLKVMGSFFVNRKKLMANGVDTKVWRKKFFNLLNSKDARTQELLKEFMTCEMQKITKHKVKRKNKYSPILFCVIRNDIEKLPKFMLHYRKLGVETFVFLDNASDDGTREYLCKQKDAIVYHSAQQYSSARRVAWLNRLLAIYGKNRWCMIVDSDEFLTYIGCENHTVSELVKEAERHQAFRIKGFMLDMYSKEELFSKNAETDFLECYKYFDTNSYLLRGDANGTQIKGGPRNRVFRREMLLSKYPVFFFREDDFVASSHYLIPNEPDGKCPVWLALCHYKFIDKKDLEKVEEAVQKGNYAGGSEDYKTYFSKIRSRDSLTFYKEDCSCELRSSEDLKKISFLKTPF